MADALRLVGHGLEVPVVGGRRVRSLNLDFAASAPALQAVHDAVEEFLPWYSSVHRGAGFKSQVSTEVYEAARAQVAAFVEARDDDVVVITRNTTDALNLLASTVPADTEVVTFGAEHHANLLPWRRRTVRHLAVPDDPTDVAGVLDEALAAGPAERTLVAVTGASNVTGELWPIADIVATAHRHGARVVLDAAQLAPHAPIDVRGWDVDWVALSGHKLYAPYGAGALVGRRDWLEAGDPFLAGGGAVTFVTLDNVAWAPLPDRQEAGSPNVVGAVALAVACRTLREHGMDRVAAHETVLAAHLAARLDRIDGIRRLTLWGDGHPRIGVVTFDVAGYHHNQVASYLSAEHGIAVRDGCFCAHPLMLRLLAVDDGRAEEIRSEMIAGHRATVPGAVRISTGLATTTADLDRAADALAALVAGGPRWTYRLDERLGEYLPDPDDRPMPAIAALRAPHGVDLPSFVGESS